MRRTTCRPHVYLMSIISDIGVFALPHAMHALTSAFRSHVSAMDETKCITPAYVPFGFDEPQRRSSVRVDKKYPAPHRSEKTVDILVLYRDRHALIHSRMASSHARNGTATVLRTMPHRPLPVLQMCRV